MPPVSASKNAANAPERKLLTREEFERLRLEQARAMAADKALERDALDVLARADHYHWIHQSTWFGEPVLNVPQDMFALQEIIFSTRPDYVLEVGVAWGGSLLFYATLMEALGGKGIIGIDTYIPDDLRTRLAGFPRLSKKIHLVNGSSVDPQTVAQTQAITGGTRKLLVVLDSDHSHDHVLKELRTYAPLVGRGHYLVCSDTIVERLPLQTHRPRPWGPGNNPATALAEFLREDHRFEVDHDLENKLLFTCNPGGFLRCTSDLPR